MTKPVDLVAVREARRILAELATTYPELSTERAQRALLTEANMADSSQIAVRLPNALLAKIDAFRAEIEKAQPGLEPSRADAVRILVTRGLDAAEKRRGR